LARAKNTSRAESRRKYREQARAAGAEIPDELDDEVVEAIPQERTSMFRMPNVLEDLRILPGMLRSEWKLWIPFLMLFGAFLLALGYWSWGIVPEDMAGLVSLVVSLVLQPTGLFVFFIGGFLAPRASYLVGATLGIVDGILFALLVMMVPAEATAPPGGEVPDPTVTTAVEPGQLIAYVGIAMMVGILAAGFAAWYRNFLRNSQERARQNRMAREQQARIKAKEDARAAKEAQRQANRR
jgi:hypothetical protein